jgi:hypothetical protein
MILRRSILIALLAGIFALPIAAFFPDSTAAQFLGFCSIGALLGVQIWAVVFLKVEPTLSRTGLLIVAFVSVSLFLWAASAAH